MSSEKPFRKINELVVALAAAEKGLTAGTLDLSALESACMDARELYERLIVLRHKAREAAIGHAPQVEGPVPEHVADRPQELEQPAPMEPKALRLDTRPPVEATPRQTSLIEAIAITEQEQPEVVADAVPSSPKRTIVPAPPSLAEKLEKASLTDLGKAISVSHKFWFVAELFNGDRAMFDRSITRLNSFSGLAEAQHFVQVEVIAKLKKPADPEALNAFNELVQRRYA